MAYVAYANTGELKEISVGELSLEKLQSLVGGYVERILGRAGTVIYADEEAKLTGKPYNHIASMAAGISILGDAVMLTKQEDLEWQS